MKRPNAPEGWRMEKWGYRGELPRDYSLGDDREVIFSLHRGSGEREEAVWLEVIAGQDMQDPNQNTFNAYRSGKHQIPHLDPRISNFSAGVAFCLEVATRYMDTPTDQIPGAREGFRDSMRKAIEYSAEQGIPAFVIGDESTK